MVVARRSTLAAELVILEAHNAHKVAINIAIKVAVKIDVRSNRPIVAQGTDLVEIPTAVAITRCRIPNSRGRAKLAREVHTFVSTVMWINKFVV